MKELLNEYKIRNARAKKIQPEIPYTIAPNTSNPLMLHFKPHPILCCVLYTRIKYVSTNITDILMLTLPSGQFRNKLKTKQNNKTETIVEG